MGTSLRKDEYVTDCSDIDDIIVFTKEGKMMVTKVDSKTFVGKEIIHVAVFKKKDKRTTYNMIYRDGKGGPSYVKRFNVTSVTRDREYDLTNGTKGSVVYYFTANPNGEAEVVNVLLRQVGSIKKLKWDLDFSDVIIKGRASKGNIVTKYSVKRIELKEKGVSTLKPRKIWFDDVVQRLNVDGRGSLLGAFKGDDLLLVITSKGVAKTMTPELSLHFDEDMIVLEKWNPNKPISAVYYDGDKKVYYLKRFLIEQPNREDQFISEHPDSFLELVSTDWRPLMELEYRKPKGKEAKPNELINIEEFIAVKGIKAQGNILTKENIKGTNLLDSLPYQEEEEKIPEEIEVVNEQELTSTDSKEEDEQSDTPSPTANNTDQPTLF